MRLLNTNHRVPGGWRYEQFSGDGRLLKKFQSFDPWPMFLGGVLSFRQLNRLPGADAETVEKDVTEYLAREFGGDPKYFTGTNQAQKKTTLTAHYPSRSALAKLAESGRKLLTGAGILSDWLGEGAKPVAPELAQARADVCTGRLSGTPCPHNNAGWKPVESIASIIRAWSAKKNEMNLSVTGEEQLHSCGVCLCDLKTKVWLPLTTILDRTPDAMLQKFDEVAPIECWIRQRK